MRSSIISDDGHLTRAGKAVRFSPEPGDDPRFFGTLTRAAVSFSGAEIDDVHDADWLAERAERMAASVLNGRMAGQVSQNSSLSGVYLRADASGLIISIPSAERDLDPAEIIGMALKAQERGLGDEGFGP